MPDAWCALPAAGLTVRGLRRARRPGATSVDFGSSGAALLAGSLALALALRDYPLLSFDLGRRPVVFRQEAFQLALFLRQRVDPVLGVADADLTHHADLGAAVAQQAILPPGGAHGRPQPTLPQGEDVPAREPLSDRLARGQLRAGVGEVDLRDEQLELATQRVELGQQLLGVLRRLVSLLHQHAGRDAVLQLGDPLLEVGATI